MSGRTDAIIASMRCVNLIALVVLVSGLTISFQTEARMYQWVDPVTGSIQMAGKPPAWYRSSWDGPRVRVLENGLLIDDTAIDVSEDEMQALREEAFRQFAQAQELEALKRLETDKLKQDERDERLSQLEDLDISEVEEESPTELPNAVSEDTIQQLKDLIDQWDTLSLP